MGISLPPGFQRQAIRLAEQGLSYRAIARKLGVHHATVTKFPEIRAARLRASPNAHSATLRTETVACRVQPATELIYRVEWTIAALLGADYRLSPNDSRRLGNILRAGLEGLAK